MTRAGTVERASSRRSVGAVAALGLLGAITGCTARCPSADERWVEGVCVRVLFDAGEGGGEIDGGGTDGGDAGEPDASADAGPCARACTGATPICDEARGECVECLAAPDCTSAARPVCASGACVECAASTDCTSAASSRCERNQCVACTADPDCSHLLGLGVCERGVCLECRAATECGGDVCDRRSGACTDLPAQALAACQACLFDEQCQIGQLCVETRYGDPPPERAVGTYCLWRRDAPLPGPNGACGLGSRPYASAREITSTGGVSTTVCELATTTCPALLQHRMAVSGCETPFTDNAACGVEGLNDGLCRLNGETQPRCSYPCLGTEDCQPGSSCPNVGDRFCSI